MGQIWVTGDTHIPNDINKISGKNWHEGKGLTKNDFLIQMGDFGLLWGPPPGHDNYHEKSKVAKIERRYTKYLNERPWTTLFICGNHENHDRLDVLPVEEKWGGKVGVVSDSIFHLRRGEIYTLHGKKFFCFGGAVSVDKDPSLYMDSYTGRMKKWKGRTEGVSWWKREIGTMAEQNYGLENLEKHGNKVDFVLSHTMPRIYKDHFKFFDYSDKWHDPTCDYLDHIRENVEYEKSFCGHFHIDKKVENHTVLYNEVEQIV